MRVNLQRVGNSRGVRLPKSVIEQCGFGDEVELEVRDGQVILSAATAARAGWDERFKSEAKDRPEDLLLGEPSNDFDAGDEWTW